MSDSTFDGNSAAGEGGAINFLADGPGGGNTFDRVDFTGNSSTGGGALRIVKDAIFPTIIVSSRFEANHATIGFGGAIACSGCDDDGSGVFLRESSVVGNTGSTVGGVTSTYVSATNTTFTGNLGESGSAISAANGQLVHVTMAENDTVSPGLAVDPGGEITTRSSILLDACYRHGHLAAGDAVPRRLRRLRGGRHTSEPGGSDRVRSTRRGGRSAHR